MIKVCVSGSKGKMGSRIIELARDDKELEVAGAFDVGEDAGAQVSLCDCLVEFTSPQATMEHAELCRKLGKAIVIGTTGLSSSDSAAIKEISDDLPVVISPNMSIGVNLLFKMIGDAARVLGDEYGISIIEAHHIHKKDSPSGTAKELAKIAKEARQGASVPIESVREGEIVGEHTITFESPVDVIEITHSAKTRDIFAKGALQAAKWLVGKKPGLYTMKDVLGL